MPSGEVMLLAAIAWVKGGDFFSIHREKKFIEIIFLHFHQF